MPATIDDLNNILAATKAQSAGLVGSAAQLEADITAAAARVSQLPTAPIDYQPQVDQVQAIKDDLTTIGTSVANATTTANGIAT